MATTVKRSPRTKRRARAKRPSKDASSWKLRSSGSLQILEAPALARLDWLVHGFSTRLGGASELAALDGNLKTKTKAGCVLNLGFTDWDTRDNVAENRTRFFSALGAGAMRVVTLRQVHSDIAHQANESNPALGAEAPKGDALLTRERGVL